MTHQLNRRHLLTGAVASMGAAAAAAQTGGDETAPATPSTAPPSCDTGLKPLRQLADEKGFQIGTAFSMHLMDQGDEARHSPHYTDLVMRECNVVVTENDFKIHRMVNLAEPGQRFPQIRWRGTDRFVHGFRSKGVAVRGHTLIWNRHVDDVAFFKAMSAEDIRAFQDWYVETIIGRYEGRVASWDVVNEPAVPGNGAGFGGYRNGPYFTGHGERYVSEAYKRARSADPSAELVLNDFAFTIASRWAGDQRASFLKILDRALDEGAPIDTVGLQSHVVMDDHLSQDAFMEYIDQLRARGVDLLITEMDIKEPVSWKSIDQRDEDLAAFTRAYLEPLMADRLIKGVLWWGLSDLRTTYYGQAMHKTATREFRPRPVLYDADYRPKPVRRVMGDLIAAL